MTISPLQQDYVTKTEFIEFSNNTNDRFDTIDESITSLRVDMERNNNEIRADMERNNERLRTSLNEDAERHMGMLLEIFQHNLKASNEQLEAKLDKKLGKEEFYEYMELHFPKQTRSRKLIK